MLLGIILRRHKVIPSGLAAEIIYFCQTMTLSKETILSIQNFFHNKPVLKAYLFGSYSRGDANEESDIDILVELDYFQHIGFEFVGMALDLEELLKKKVDFISAKMIKEGSKDNVNRDKILIYKKYSSTN